MTPEQVALVQASYAGLGTNGRELARQFYERLFESAPSVQTMFSEEPEAQAELFLSELAVIVRSISQFDSFVPRARGLGARHVAYGVNYSHYEIAGRVLLDAFAETLGSAFTQELHEAWRLAFDLVAETMMQGAADAGQ